MVYVSDIIEFMNNTYPESLSEEWDNVGLLVGRKDKEVNKALLTLDVDLNVAIEAVKIGADVII